MVALSETGLSDLSDGQTQLLEREEEERKNDSDAGGQGGEEEENDG